MSRCLRSLVGECLGTFLLVGIGTGTVASSVLLGWPDSLGAVALLWGLGVAVAITASAGLSGAHLNPAVSVSLALWRPAEFPRSRLLPYCAAQLAGALLAGGLVLAIFGPFLCDFEAREGLVRGEPGSERAAMVFGEYFPNPGMHGPRHEARMRVEPWQAALLEACGTAVLLVVVSAVSVVRGGWAKRMAPLLVGGTIAVLILLLASATQCGLNPARDLGPRIVAFSAGWGSIALPGPDGGFWVYIAGPLLGGVAGGFLGERLFGGRRRGRRAVVMFVCVHNAGRSQMAAAFARLLGGDRVEVRSAGSAPGEQVHPGVVQAMREVGVDLGAAVPRRLTRDEVGIADVIVTMGCGDACPVLPGRRYEDWAVDDPAGKPVERVRAIREDIRRRVEVLLQDLRALPTDS